MRALEREVQDCLWEVVKELIPPPREHPLGCHRPRVSDRVCFKGLLIRLVSGMSWVNIESALDFEVSDTTLRARRDEWIEAGVFDKLVDEARHGYDRIIGFELSDVVIDGSNQKAPCGGEGTGVNPYDRGKLGWKWSVAVDGNGIPLTWITDGANRNDYAMLAPTLNNLETNGLTFDIETLHLDRGYGYRAVNELVDNYEIDDLDVIYRNQPGQGTTPLVGLGKRWIVEAANGWLARYGQLRRNTDRKPKHRHAALCLATTVLITGRLIDHRNKHPNGPIR
ncbi:MAG: IS5 family transposase [Acidimicrobiales bacterium]